MSPLGHPVTHGSCTHFQWKTSIFRNYIYCSLVPRLLGTRLILYDGSELTWKTHAKMLVLSLVCPETSEMAITAR